MCSGNHHKIRKVYGDAVIFRTKHQKILLVVDRDEHGQTHPVCRSGWRVFVRHVRGTTCVRSYSAARMVLMVGRVAKKRKRA